MAISMKAARINAGLKQDEAAERLCITKQTLRSYESGRTIPRIDTAVRIAELYGMTVDDIIFLPNSCA